MVYSLTLIHAYITRGNFNKERVHSEKDKSEKFVPDYLLSLNFNSFKTFQMTSETTEKKPMIIVPKPNGNPYLEIKYGFLIVVATWIYLYFSVIPTLYDGIKDFLQNSATHIALEFTGNLLTTTLIPYLAGGGGEVEFGTPKFYLLCGVGGILSCGITHTAIVPLDLVKCRIQVHYLIKKLFNINVFQIGRSSKIQGYHWRF